MGVLIIDKEKDPALEPEGPAGSPDGDSTTTAPQVEEEAAETTEESTDESTHEGEPKNGETAEALDEHEIVLTGEPADEDSASAAPKDSAAWAQLRKQEREARQEAADLKRKLEALQVPAGVPELGPEPTLETCGYDEVRLKRELREHDQAKARKREHESRMAERAQTVQQRNQALVNGYTAAKVELSKRVPGYAEAEKVVIQAFSPSHQDALLKALPAPRVALVVCALGQRPKLLEELSRETDPVIFGVRLKELEGTITMKKKGTQVPPPERTVRGSGSMGAGDSTLERLRAKAAKTGDYTEVNAFKRRQRQAK